MSEKVSSAGQASPPTWRFLVDENLPRSLAPDLVALGYSAEHVYDLGMSGAKDASVYAYAQSQQEIIITSDKDFSNVLDVRYQECWEQRIK